VLADAAANETTLTGFLAELALDPPASSADYAKPPHLDEDYLTLSTIHSAKGLEWDSVHVISASDGNFASDMALTTPEGLEEERRLFYVALTSARRTLTIYAPLRYYHRPTSNGDAHGYGKKSRFPHRPRSRTLRADPPSPRRPRPGRPRSRKPDDQSQGQPRPALALKDRRSRRTPTVQSAIRARA
jgi:DNA helicase-2/ATP-dependent DNA helicase PcrA